MGEKIFVDKFFKMTFIIGGEGGKYEKKKTKKKNNGYIPINKS